MSLDRHLNKGTRKILTWAQQHPIELINYNYQKYDPFFNINTKDDLKKAKKFEIFIITQIQYLLEVKALKYCYLYYQLRHSYSDNKNF